MPHNFPQFATALREFTNVRLKRDQRAFQKMLVKQLARAVIFRTRRKTGKLRGGWRASSGLLDEKDQPTDFVGTATMRAVEMFLRNLPDRARDSRGRFSTSDHLETISFGNPVEYAVFIEDMDNTLGTAIATIESRFRRVREVS